MGGIIQKEGKKKRTGREDREGKEETTGGGRVEFITLSGWTNRRKRVSHQGKKDCHGRNKKGDVGQEKRKREQDIYHLRMLVQPKNSTREKGSPEKNGGNTGLGDAGGKHREDLEKNSA